MLVGTRSAAEVRDAAWMLDHPIPSELWEDLRAESLLPKKTPVPWTEEPCA